MNQRTKADEPAGNDSSSPGMHWRPLADRVKWTVSQQENALLIELASSAVLLAWMAHWIAE